MPRESAKFLGGALQKSFDNRLLNSSQDSRGCSLISGSKHRHNLSVESGDYFLRSSEQSQASPLSRNVSLRNSLNKIPIRKKAAPLSNFCKQLRHLTSSQSLIPRHSLKSSSPWLDCARDSAHRLKRPVVKYSRTPCGSLGLSRPINLSKNCSQCPRSKDCPQTRVSSSSSNLRP